MEEYLVGRSHECNYPPSVCSLPVLTKPKYPANFDTDGGEIHRSITSLIKQALSVYEVFDSGLEELSPDVILTQDHCEVCAVSQSQLRKAVLETVGEATEIISVSPHNLESVFESFLSISEKLGSGARGRQLVKAIRERFWEIEKTVSGNSRPDVVAVEWMEPVMTGGNWMPELIEIAGGRSRLASAGEHSPWTEMHEIKRCDPDILLIVPCGYSVQKTLNELHILTGNPLWCELSAVKNKQVYILDGNHYFNRPGPRIKESAELLGHLFHPEDIADPTGGTGWYHYPG